MERCEREGHVCERGGGGVVLFHRRGQEAYFPEHLQAKLREVKEDSARAIFDAIYEDLLRFGTPHDDTSFVVVKRD